MKSTRKGERYELGREKEKVTGRKSVGWGVREGKNSGDMQRLSLQLSID